MRRLVWFVFVLAALTATSARFIAAQDQTPSHYVISAKAGRLNSVTGQVLVQRQGATEWQPLVSSLRQQLETGDAAQTGTDGRLEMLLNPGSYMRLGENSEFQLTNAVLGDLQIKLLKGTMIVEATGTDGTRLLATIKTPQTSITIDRNGLYRINVTPAGATEVLVRKGRAMLNGGTVAKVEGGKKILVEKQGSEIVKFDKKVQDNFDQWSKQRAETLAAANRRLSNSLVMSAFASYRRNGAFGYGYAPYFGLWVFDSSLSGYTFLPFYDRWSSPYGIGYGRGFGFSYSNSRPIPINSQPIYTGGGGGGGESGSNPIPPVAGTQPIEPPSNNVPINPVDPSGESERTIRERPFYREVPDMPSRKDSAERFDRDFGGRRETLDSNVDIDRSSRGNSEATHQSPVHSESPRPDPAPTPSAPERSEPVERESSRVPSESNP